MAPANAISGFVFTLTDGNNNLGTFSADPNDLAGGDNVLRLFERIRSTPGLESVPALAVLTGLNIDDRCLLGIGEKGLSILNKLSEDLYFFRFHTCDILNIDIQGLDINHLVGFEKCNVSLKRQLEIWSANETPEPTTEHRYANNGSPVGSEVVKKAFSNTLAELVEGLECLIEEFKFYLEQFDQFKSERILEELDLLKFKSILEELDLLKFKSIIEEFDQFDVLKLVESFLGIDRSQEGRNAYRRVVEAINSTVEAGHTREGHNLCPRAFEATEFVKFIVEISDALKDRNTCHGAFDVIELVKSTVDVGHAPRVGETRKEIANGWHQCHSAEGIALGLTAGPCAVF